MLWKWPRVGCGTSRKEQQRGPKSHTNRMRASLLEGNARCFRGEEHASDTLQAAVLTSWASWAALLSRRGGQTLSVLFWGAAAGVVHFVFIGFAYGNPLVDRLSAKAEAESPAVKQWPSKPKYFLTQFLGTQVEVYLLTLGFCWLRPFVEPRGYGGALLLGLLFAAIRVYPRFWNMWIQTTYPNRLLAIEVVNGTLGTLVIAVFLQAVTHH